MKHIKTIPQNGDTRIKFKFLFLPTIIYKDNKREMRWLEFATVEQRYYYYNGYGEWMTISFID